MGFSPRMYEIHVLMPDELGDLYWEPYVMFESREKAFKIYREYVEDGYNVRVVETKVVAAYEDGTFYA